MLGLPPWKSVFRGPSRSPPKSLSEFRHKNRTFSMERESCYAANLRSDSTG